MNKLYIVCGIPFSGKSTLAKEITNRFDFERVDLDDVKFQLYGEGIEDEKLQQKDWDVIYQKMYQIINTLLMQGKTVIHDTGNFTRHERDLVRQIANKLGVESIVIFVDTPKSVAYKRLRNNRKTKTRFDVTDKNFESSVAEMEPPEEDEEALVFKVDDDISSWVSDNMRR